MHASLNIATSGQPGPRRRGWARQPSSQPRPPFLLGPLVLGMLILGLGTFPDALRASSEEGIEIQAFFIESIEIEGIRQVSTDILLAESRLQAGAEYTEVELSKAVHRMLRLPFVLDARLSLQRGSERGRYLLRVTIEETRRFFYFGELVAQESNIPDTSEVGRIGVLGWRHFLGRAGMLFAAADADGLQAGYSHYDLLGKGIFLSLSYSRNGCCLGTIFPLGLEPVETITPGESELGQLIVGLPLKRNQSLFLSASRQEDDEGLLRQDRLAISWVRDTSDDPFFPTRGVRVVTQLETTDSDVRFRIAGGFETGRLLESSSLSVSSAQHWPIGDGHAMSLIVQGGVGRTQLRDEFGKFETGFLSGSIGTRFSANLLRGAARQHLDDLRWETSLLYEAQIDFATRSFGFLDGSRRQARATTSIAMRHDWGILRLGFVYLWDEDGGIPG